jgi:Glyoxalase-like domain
VGPPALPARQAVTRGPRLPRTTGPCTCRSGRRRPSPRPSPAMAATARPGRRCDPAPSLKLTAPVFDAPDPRALAEFHGRLLGWTIGTDEPDWVTLRAPDGVRGCRSSSRRPTSGRPGRPAPGISRCRSTWTSRSTTWMPPGPTPSTRRGRSGQGDPPSGSAGAPRPGQRRALAGWAPSQGAAAGARAQAGREPRPGALSPGWGGGVGGPGART